MRIILDDLLNVSNYLDDIIIWGCTAEELERLPKAILQRLQDTGLQINVTSNKPAYNSWVTNSQRRVSSLTSNSCLQFYRPWLQRML